MKKYIVIVSCLSIGWLVYPPQSGHAEGDQPRLTSEITFDTVGISHDNAVLVDSFARKNVELNARIDTIMGISNRITSAILDPKYLEYEYKPAISVMKLSFKNKNILARYDSICGCFVELEVQYK